MFNISIHALLNWRTPLTASTHLAVGAAASIVAQRFLSSPISNARRLFWGFVAGYASHLLLDSFPHQEYGIGGIGLGSVLFVEIVATFFLFFFSFKPRSLLADSIIFLGMVGGAIPDFIYFVSRYFLTGSQSEDLATIIHLFSHEAIPLGFEISIYFQLLITLTAITFVRFKSA